MWPSATAGRPGVCKLLLDVGDDPVDDELPEAEQHSNWWIRTTAKFSDRIHWILDSSAPPGPQQCGDGEHPARVVPVADEPFHRKAFHSLGVAARLVLHPYLNN